MPLLLPATVATDTNPRAYKGPTLSPLSSGWRLPFSAGDRVVGGEKGSATKSYPVFQLHQELGESAAKKKRNITSKCTSLGYCSRRQPVANCNTTPLPIRLIPPCPLPRSHNGKGAAHIGRDARRVAVQVGVGNAPRDPSSRIHHVSDKVARSDIGRLELIKILLHTKMPVIQPNVPNRKLGCIFLCSYVPR